MSWIGSSGSSVDHPGGSIDSVKTPSVPRGGGAKASEIVGEAGVVKALTAPPQSKTAEIAGGSGGKGGGPGGGATTDTLSDPATSSAGPGEIDLSTKIDNNHNTK